VPALQQVARQLTIHNSQVPNAEAVRTTDRPRCL
jgi:hypothetical protein